MKCFISVMLVFLLLFTAVEPLLSAPLGAGGTTPPVQQQTYAPQAKPEHSPELAVLFGLLLPGAGQIYNGELLKAVFVWGGVTGAIILGYCLEFSLFYDEFSETSSGVGLLIGYSGVCCIRVWELYDAYTTAVKIKTGRYYR